MISINLWRAPNQPEIIQSWTFHYNNVLRIGRALDNDVVIPHPAVSRYHAELKRTTRGWNLTNLGVNNTFWRGQPIHYISLPDEAVIQLAASGPSLLLRILPDCAHKDNPTEALFCCHCGAPLYVKKVIREYQVIQVLGQGGMGTTYLVWRAGKVQVLKEMNAELINNPKARELFEREAYVLSRLNHSGIPKFQDYFIENQSKYLVMETVYGLDLFKWIQKRGAVSPQQAIAWMLQLCDILTYLHSQEPPIVHRDVKPANIMVRNVDGSLVLLDFGAVKEIGALTGTRIGAPSYSPPEQNQGKPVIQSDLYAIAPTLIFLLTGQDPSSFLDNRGQGIRMYADQIPGVSPQLANVILKLSAPIASDRYQSAAEVAAALKACLSI